MWFKMDAFTHGILRKGVFFFFFLIESVKKKVATSPVRLPFSAYLLIRVDVLIRGHGVRLPGGPAFFFFFLWLFTNWVILAQWLEGIHPRRNHSNWCRAQRKSYRSRLPSICRARHRATRKQKENVIDGLVLYAVCLRCTSFCITGKIPVNTQLQDWFYWHRETLY